MKTKAIPRVSVSAEICHNTTMVRRVVSQHPVLADLQSASSYYKDLQSA